MSRSDEKDRAFLDIAIRLGQLGTCDRAKVGAVLTIDGRAVSWGYNGAPPGLPHCDENDHGWMQTTGTGLALLEEQFPGEPDAVMAAIKRYGCRNVIHAEQNAVAFAARQGVRTEGGTMYVVVSPCATCAQSLVAAGIKRVVWATTYRDPRGSQILEAAGIEKVVLLPDD